MAKASYNNGIEVVELTILSKNKDGSLELSVDGENLKVGKCTVDDSNSDKPAVGTCRPIQEAPTPKAPKDPPAK